MTITDGGGYAIKVYNRVSKSNNGDITFNCNFYVKGGSVNMSGSGYFNMSSGKYFYFDGNTTIGDITTIQGDITNLQTAVTLKVTNITSSATPSIYYDVDQYNITA